MTTTAATSSASSRTPNDSPTQDNIGASEPIQQQQQLQQQNHQEQLQQEDSRQLQQALPQQQQQSSKQQPQQPPSTNNIEQKRPMNAFLLFCKRHRSSVREKYPNLENRNITRILGDWWSKLDKEQKDKYTDQARQHKEAFMKAYPDFKWCKTPMSNNNISNNNNNNNSNSNNNSNTVTRNECHLLNNRHTKSLNPAQIDVGPSNSSNKDTLTNRQHEAPKPPKKRFLERNDSDYTKNSSASSNNESNHHAKDGCVPYISLDQDTLDRVIDEAFSERSNGSPSGMNMCKCSNRITTNSNASLSVTNQSPFSVSTSYPNNIDEPVDFSMSRTISTTSQQIIDNLVEKMLSEPDNICSTSKLISTHSALSQHGPVKRDTKHDSET